MAPEHPVKSGRVFRVTAHVDHGKTTVMDSIIASHGHISHSLAGELRYMDSRTDEQNREITLKLGFVGLPDGNVFIDTPGHVDFDSFMFSSSLLSDCHIFIVDVNEGVTPRTYAQMRHIDIKNTILVLNKIDRCDNIEIVLSTVNEINALSADYFPSRSFAWESGNIVLSDAIHCCGLSSLNFRFGTKNTIKNAFKAYKLLNEMYDKSVESSENTGRLTEEEKIAAALNIDKLMKKYKIRYKSKKNILGTIMPLSDAIYDALDGLKPGSSNGLSSCFYNIQLAGNKESISFLGIASCCIWKEPGVLSEDNILFVCKIQQGVIREGDMVWSKTTTEESLVRVEAIYKFVVNTPSQIENSQGTPLVCLKGNFLKNSIISSEPVSYTIQNIPLPFYTAKLILDDLAQLEDIKKAIKALSYVEHPLKAKKNKYSEIEIQCCGMVQFEKICNDLQGANFNFSVGKPVLELREKITIENRSHYISDELEFTLEIKPYSSPEPENETRSTEDELDLKNTKRFSRKEGMKLFVIKNSSAPHLVESILEMFTESGPLIKEKIIEIEIIVTFMREQEAITYSILKKEISDLYMKSMPVGCPRTVLLHILLEHKYIDIAYSVFRKYFFSLVDGDDYDDSRFTSIRCKIPQFCLKTMEEELRRKTRGTVCIDVISSSFEEVKEFEKIVENVRVEKGIVADRKIVENPEQQRTLKR